MVGAVTDEQVVAANVDVIFIVMALDDDFSVRRLERYLPMARERAPLPLCR
jgi:ribosome biogenesis GTPase